MADPVVTLLANNSSSTATTTVSFTAQSAGTVLVLCIVADDYPTTSGTGRPESSGWTLPTNASLTTGSGANCGLGLWYLKAAGSETSVQYTIGSASHSVYRLYALTNVDQTTPFDIANKQFANSFATSYTTPAVAPTTGRRFALGLIGGSTSGNDVTGMGTWLNSYTDQGTTVGGTSPQINVGNASLALDGDGTTTTSTGATFTGNGPGNRVGLIAVFRVAAAGGGVTGTLAVTEANDTSAASGVLGYSGTLAATEANDTSAAAGVLGYTGTLARTEANDTSAASGTFTPSGISGSVAVTEANDTAAAAGVLGYAGTLARTEANDVLAAAGLVANPVTGTLAVAEANDTLAASGMITGLGAPVAPAERTYIVPLEQRAYTVPAENRTTVITADNRTDGVTP